MEPLDRTNVSSFPSYHHPSEISDDIRRSQPVFGFRADTESSVTYTEGLAQGVNELHVSEGSFAQRVRGLDGYPELSSQSSGHGAFGGCAEESDADTAASSGRSSFSSSQNSDYLYAGDAREEFAGFLDDVDAGVITDQQKADFIRVFQSRVGKLANPELIDDFERWLETIVELDEVYVDFKDSFISHGVPEFTLPLRLLSCDGLTGVRQLPLSLLADNSEKFDTEIYKNIRDALEKSFNDLNLHDVTASLRYNASSTTASSDNFKPANLRYSVAAISIGGKQLRIELPICLRAEEEMNSQNGVLFCADAAYLNHCWQIHNPGYELGYEIEPYPEQGPARAMVFVKKQGFPITVRGQIGYPLYSDMTSVAVKPAYWFECLNICRRQVEQANSQGFPSPYESRINLEDLSESSLGYEDIPNAPKNTVSTYFFQNIRAGF